VPTPDVAGSDSNQLLGTAVVGPTEAWAVGMWRRADPSASNFQPIAERWTAGQGWRMVATASLTASADARFAGVTAVSSTDVWAAGSSGLALAETHGFFERWNGSAWTVVPIPDLGQQARLFGVAAASANDVWAVGDLFDSESALVLHWNGTAWSRVPLTTSAPLGESRLRAVTAVSGNDVWAVGQQGSGTRTLAAHWNGTAFTVAPSPNVPSQTHSFFTAVSATASNDVWAVGSSLVGGAFAASLTAHWDGAAWTIVAGPTPADSLADLLGVGGRAGGPMFAVGDRRPASDGFLNHTFAVQAQSS
jgi:hypothetical protein